MIRYRVELPDLMKRLNLPLVAAELGVAEGYNAADLLKGGLKKLYLVDAWATLPGRGDGAFVQEWHDENLKKTQERVSAYGDRAVFLRGLTTEMAHKVPDESLGMIYLDAAHWYDDVLNDLRAWFPKLVKGGICAGHDYLATQYQVYQAVQDFTQGDYEIHTIRENKPEDAGFLFIK